MKHSEIRQTIVATATHLFYANGYNKTGVNEIIDKAGIAKATLYNHFPSKEDICLAYLQHKHAVFSRDIKAYCHAKPKGEKRVLAIFDYLHDFFQDNDFNGCWCIKTVAEIPKDNVKIKNEIKAQKLAFITFINSLIRDNIGKSDSNEAESLGRKIYLLYESAVAESHLQQADWPIVEMKHLCSQIIE